MNTFVGYKSQDLQVKIDEAKMSLNQLVLKENNEVQGFQHRVVVIDRFYGRLAVYRDSKMVSSRGQKFQRHELLQVYIGD